VSILPAEAFCGPGQHSAASPQVRTDKDGATPRCRENGTAGLIGRRYLIEWRENGRRLRQAAGVTPAEAMEAQKRKRLELDAHSTGLAVLDPVDEAKADALPLTEAVDKFLQDIRTFRKEYTWKKYKCVLELFAAFYFGISRGALYPNAAENIRQISSVLMIGSLIVALLGTVFIRRFARTAYLVASISLLVVPGVSANF
jgi:hypothetical protein